MSLFDTVWTQALRDLMPWATIVFLAITELGGTYAYLIILILGFWVIDKRETIGLGMVYLFSGAVNYLLKGLIMHPRPPQAEWLPGASASGYSFPSGHAQSSAVVYGWLAIKIRRWWTTLIFGAIIFLVGISRIYIGVHWLGDVLAGWAIGIGIVLLFWKLERPIEARLSSLNRDLKYGLLLAIGIGLTIIMELIISVPDSNFGSTSGLIVGFAIGLWLEGKYINFSTTPKNCEKWRLVLRVVFGFILVVGLMLVLTEFLGSDIVWTHMLRYAIVAVVGTFVWPAIFSRLGL